MRRSTAGLTVALVLGASVLAGCGDKEKDADGGEDKDKISTAADREVCAADAKAVATPYDANFPEAWTFPDKTVVYNVEERDGAGVIVTGTTTTPFADVLAYLNDTVTGEGFAFDHGETEDDDAESNWSTTGYTGRWAIRKSSTCDGETVIQVLATPAT